MDTHPGLRIGHDLSHPAAAGVPMISVRHAAITRVGAISQCRDGLRIVAPDPRLAVSAEQSEAQELVSELAMRHRP